MEEGEHDKSEQPTPFKLQKSRQKGMVARGLDLGFLTGLAGMLGSLWLTRAWLASSLTEAARRTFLQSAASIDHPSGLLQATAALFLPVLKCVVVMIAAVFLLVLILELVQTGFVFSTHPLKPDFSRLNPAKGLKRIFSLRLLIETLKNIAKLAAYTTIAFLIIRAACIASGKAVTDGRHLAGELGHVGLELVAAFLLAAVVFAALDQIIVRRQFLTKMRMSRREIRKEAKDREGEPRLKQKRKQLHREFTKSSQSLRSVRNADVLVTNPDHIAVGLSYQAHVMSAPRVVAIGVNHLAQRLRRLAFCYGIPIVEDRALARQLYGRSALNRAIPEDCYARVADIYNALRPKQPEEAEPQDA